MSFVYTTAIGKLRKLSKRIKIVRGGTSAGKTFGILPVLIDRATKQSGLEISVVAETIPHLRRGAMKDFIKIMQATNRFFDSNWNRSLLTYRFANGSFIEFFSAEQPDKLRGARRNILYINECNNVDFESYSQLAIRTSDEIWLDYNPVAQFWVDTELANDQDAEMIVLTYKDNEALSESIIKEIEKAKDKAATSDYWANWWRVYGLGEIGTLQEVVFSEWNQIDAIPKDARLVGYGLDFGYTNDPTAVIAAYKMDNKYYFDEVLYQKGLTNSEIANHLKSLNVDRGQYIICDSAEPKSIQELANYGFKVEGAQKGADSIRISIDALKRDRFYVTKSSTNLIKELRSYTWAKDKQGNVQDKPVDYMNHAIDAVRYFALNNIVNNTRGVYGFR
jgi:phage terminase large subunit